MLGSASSEGSDESRVTKATRFGGWRAVRSGRRRFLSVKYCDEIRVDGSISQGARWRGRESAARFKIADFRGRKSERRRFCPPLPLLMQRARASSPHRHLKKTVSRPLFFKSSVPRTHRTHTDTKRTPTSTVFHTTSQPRLRCAQRAQAKTTPPEASEHRSSFASSTPRARTHTRAARPGRGRTRVAASFLLGPAPRA